MRCLENDPPHPTNDILFLFESGFTAAQISSLKGISEESVQTILDERIATARQTKQQNVIQDIGNKNPWKDGVPERKVVREVVQSVAPVEVDLDSYGARTVPSRPIKPTDRSDRVGEDTVLMDRVHAAAEQDGLEEDAAKIFEDIEFKQRQSKRKELKSALDDVKELVDDDLEF